VGVHAWDKFDVASADDAVSTVVKQMGMQLSQTETRQITAMWIDIFYLQLSRLEEAIERFSALRIR
jgi:hypothetical protein